MLLYDFVSGSSEEKVKQHGDSYLAGPEGKKNVFWKIWFSSKWQKITQSISSLDMSHYTAEVWRGHVFAEHEP